LERAKGFELSHQSAEVINSQSFSQQHGFQGGAQLANLVIARHHGARTQIGGGCPERFAQEALGHNSKAVHRAYAKRAQMKIPSLEDYEQRAL
jgi:hypothetical protein